MDAKKVKYDSRDDINCLPEEILARILSFLPTKRAVSTSLVSKRWRNLFPLMIKLFGPQHDIYLDDSDLVYPKNVGKRDRKDVQKSFGKFLKKILSECNYTKKLTLKFHLNCMAHTDTTARWLSLALERGIVDLDVLFKMGYSPSQTRWPCNAFIHNNTLVKLTLRIEFGQHRLFFLEPACLPVLKSLSLHIVWSLFLMLFRSIRCPILEELSLHHLRGASQVGQHEEFFITHKNLKRLTFDYSTSLPRFRQMLFITPSLVYLDYSGCALVTCSYPYSQLDSPVEAKLDLCPSTSNYRSLGLYSIINCLHNVKTLSLSSASVKEMYSTGEELPFFLNLVKLFFESDTKEGWQLMLPLLLNQSPKLKTLVLKGLHGVGNEGIHIDQNEVKVLEIYGFSGSRGEMKLVECFLWQIQFLQVMKLRIDADEDNMKLQLINHILDLRVGSSHNDSKKQRPSREA